MSLILSKMMQLSHVCIVFSSYPVWFSAKELSDFLLLLFIPPLPFPSDIELIDLCWFHAEFLYPSKSSLPMVLLFFISHLSDSMNFKLHEVTIVLFPMMLMIWVSNKNFVCFSCYMSQLFHYWFNSLTHTHVRAHMHTPMRMHVCTHRMSISHFLYHHNGL
jgi:hypothetical protein